VQPGCRQRDLYGARCAPCRLFRSDHGAAQSGDLVPAILGRPIVGGHHRRFDRNGGMNALANTRIAFRFDRRTRRGTGLVALLAIVGIAYASSFDTLARMWELSSYRHGYIIPFVSVFLLYRDRAAFGAVQWRGSVVGLIALAMSVWVWSIA